MNDKYSRSITNFDYGELHKDMAKKENRLAGKYDASDIFEHLMKRVTQFENSLGENEEVGLQLANFGKAAEIHIRSVGYQNPNLIEFIGVDLDKNDVTLIQHISQLNFLLVAVKPVNETAYRVGFLTKVDSGKVP